MTEASESKNGSKKDLMSEEEIAKWRSSYILQFKILLVILIALVVLAASKVFLHFPPIPMPLPLLFGATVLCIAYAIGLCFAMGGLSKQKRLRSQSEATAASNNNSIRNATRACPNCSAEIGIRAAFCSECGTALPELSAADLLDVLDKQESAQSSVPAVNNAPSFGFAVLGFLVPIVGLVLYLMWKDEKPGKARSAGKGALIAVCIEVAFIVIYFIVIAVILGSAW